MDEITKKALQDVLPDIAAGMREHTRLSLMSSIYLIQCGDFVKIGFSLNPENRFLAIKGMMPYDCTLLYHCKVENAAALEAELHALFGNKRHKNEWFRLTADDLREIQKICENS